MSQRAHGLHHHLRFATAAAHSNLERTLATRGYFDTRDGYIDYLRRFHAFHDEAERFLDAGRAGQFIPDWEERRRAYLARIDLQTLGESAPLPAAPSGLLPRLSGVEQVLGVAYVLEGSTLGGAFLLKQLAPLGISASHGGSYLASYGNERGKMWQKFLATLEEAHSHVQAAAVASAALRAFNAARYFLTEASCVRAAPNVASTSSAAMTSTCAIMPGRAMTPGVEVATSVVAASAAAADLAPPAADQPPARACSMVA